jgi:hypothetical protein
MGLRVARNIAELEQFRNEWSHWYQDPDLDMDVFLAEQRVEEGVSRPYALGIYREGRPECLLIARISTARMGLNFGGARMRLPEARTIRMIANGNLGVQNQRNSELLVRGLIDALRKGEADVAELPHIRIDSSLYKAVTTLPSRLCRDHFPPRVLHRCLRLPASYQKFLTDLSRNKRHNLARSAKTLLTRFSGEVSIRSFAGDIALADFIEDCETVASRAYQRELGTGFVDNSVNRERLRVQAEKGYLLGYVLYIAEKPIAFVMGTERDGTFCGKTMAYDSDYRKIFTRLISLDPLH